MNIHNRMIEIVNSYNYEKEVVEFVSELKETLGKKKSNEILYLDCTFDNRYEGEEEDIAQKVAEKLINFRIREKAYVTLMAEGLIYPIELCNGDASQKVSYTVNQQSGTSITETHITYRRLIFNMFMKK